MIGAHSAWAGDPGLVYVFEGPIEGELKADDAWAIWRGEEPGAYTGFHVSMCDTNRDGRSELVVGAPHVDGPERPDGFVTDDAGVVYWLRP